MDDHVTPEAFKNFLVKNFSLRDLVTIPGFVNVACQRSGAVTGGGLRGTRVGYVDSPRVIGSQILNVCDTGKWVVVWHLNFSLNEDSKVFGEAFPLDKNRGLPKAIFVEWEDAKRIGILDLDKVRQSYPGEFE